MKKLKKILKYINKLQASSFEGWSHEEKNSYLSACGTIINQIIVLQHSEITIHKKNAINFAVGSYVIYQDEVKQIIDKHFGNEKLVWLRRAQGTATKKTDLYQFYVNDKLIPMSGLLYNFFYLQICETLEFSDIEEQQNSKTFTKHNILSNVSDSVVNKLFKLI